MRDNGYGFTLVEILIAVVILTIVMLAVLDTLSAGHDAHSMGNATLAVQTMNTRLMADVSRRIRESRVFGVAPDGSWIRLQVPVDHDGDGDVLDENKCAEWGASNKLNWYLEYAYYSEADVAGGKGWVFDESKEGRTGVDLNRDGDKNDRIEIGYIVERLKDENGVEVYSRQLTPRCVVLDMDGDGLRDPLFKRLYSNGTDDPDGDGPQPPDNEGPTVRISFWSFKVAVKDRKIVLHPTSTVGTRNI